MNVKFVVCPTTKSARDAWEQHTPNLLSVFGEFLPETGIVDVWPDFDPDHPVEAQHIRSLVHQVRQVHSSPPSKSKDLGEELRSSWFWNSLPIALFSFALFGYLSMHEAEKEERIAVVARMSSMQSEIAGLQKSQEEVRQLHVADARLWDDKFAKMEQKKKELEHDLGRQQKVVEESKQHLQTLSDRIRHCERLTSATNHSQWMMPWHTCTSCEDRAADSLLHFESTAGNDDFNDGYAKKSGETCNEFQGNTSHHGNRPSDQQLGGIRSTTFASFINYGIDAVSNVLQNLRIANIVAAL